MNTAHLDYDKLVKENRVRKTVLRQTLALEWTVVRNWATALLFVLPLAMLWGPRPIRWAGVVYLVLYVMAMLPNAAAHILMGYDAIRIILKKQQLLLPSMVGMGIAARKAYERGKY